MPGKAPDGWQNFTARELDEQFAMVLHRIGERLAKNATTPEAPLPERMTALLDELRRHRARNRSGR
ncbi:hypothetical protein [Methylocystis sp. B8]|uniref:hypothetical protein n=1 Tax=Methylocystis sp. B8 TaxID=544938 RepID=UPI0010FE5D71|nr:hypothetical protein [Methylocystis sp. B8]TLG79321.1 hypothetical protein FEV16_04795 [Methylocystis sp. B8]